MRWLTEHEANYPKVTVEVATEVHGEEPGPGGAQHYYLITPPNGTPHGLNFQNGPVGEVGINGITEESLLVIVLDRLRDFNKGDYKCRENALAITNLEQGLMWLHKRTRNRMERGVEGTHEV